MHRCAVGKRHFPTNYSWINECCECLARFFLGPSSYLSPIEVQLGTGDSYPSESIVSIPLIGVNIIIGLRPSTRALFTQWDYVCAGRRPSLCGQCHNCPTYSGSWVLQLDDCIHSLFIRQVYDLPRLTTYALLSNLPAMICLAVLPRRIRYSFGPPTLRTSPLRNNSSLMVQIMDLPLL